MGELARLARESDILPVTSAGKKELEGHVGSVAWLVAMLVEVYTTRQRNG